MYESKPVPSSLRNEQQSYGFCHASMSVTRSTDIVGHHLKKRISKTLSETSLFGILPDEILGKIIEKVVEKDVKYYCNVSNDLAFLCRPLLMVGGGGEIYGTPLAVALRAHCTVRYTTPCL